MKFEIQPGIIISKLDLRDGDTIIITMDLDRYDLDEAYHISKIIVNEFPYNDVKITFKGLR